MHTLARVVMGSLAAATLASAASTASAAEFPERPIEMIIPFGAGSGADIEGRLLADEMSKVLGQPVVPINKPGGGGAITYTHIMNSAPDGYTIAWNSTSILTTTNIGNVDFTYDAMDHVGMVEFQPMPFVVKADSKWNSFNDFVADCKANPKTLKVAFAGVGSATHVAGIALMETAGCEAIMLPVKAADRNKFVLSGEADAAMHIFVNPLKLVKAGKLKFLVITSAERSPATPDVPTAKELGYDVELDLFRGLSVPKGTPAPVRAKLEAAMIQAANSDSFKARAKKLGFNLEPLGSEAFAEKLKANNEQVVAVMKQAGLYQSKKK